MSIAELFDKAQVLPAVEREQLALMLLDSLPQDDESPIVLDPEYEAELERRLEDIRAGRAKGHDLATVMDSLRATMRKHAAP